MLSHGGRRRSSHTAPEAFGAGIVSNTYSGGQGVITFDGTVTKVGGSTFDGCATLASIDIPEEATVIGDYAFYNCSAFTSVTVPADVTIIRSDKANSMILGLL